jgi:hypothetical protein
VNRKPALKGLLLGDSLSRQNAQLRLNLTTPKRIDRFNSLQKFSYDSDMTTYPEPYTHAHDPSLLKFFPGDDCEWLFFSAYKFDEDSDILEKWDVLSKQKNVRARLGTKSALRNLLEGLNPPASGNDNPHYFDSISILRAAGMAIFSNNNNGLMEKIKRELEITHALDGVWCGLAVARMIISIKDGRNIEDAISDSLIELPESSWSRREILKALKILDSDTSPLGNVLKLENEFVDRIYCYPYSAPELLGLVFNKLLLKGDPRLILSTSFMHRRHTDSLPPILGLLMGFILGDGWIPDLETQNYSFDGVCIPSLRGRNLLELLS